MVGQFIVVVLAGVGAYLYPSYAAWLPVRAPLDGTGAHVMAVYLVAIGLIFMVVTRPRRRRAPATQSSKGSPPVSAAKKPVEQHTANKPVEQQAAKPVKVAPQSPPPPRT